MFVKADLSYGGDTACGRVESAIGLGGMLPGVITI